MTNARNRLAIRGPARRAAGGAAGAFTLIEILVVVVILGIAAAIVVPAIGSRSDLKATSAARMIMADLIYAQNRSIAQQKMHWVRFDAVNEQYEVLEQITPGPVYIKHPVEAQDFIVKIGGVGTNAIKDVSIDTVQFDTKTVLAFDELGTPYAYDPGTNAMSPMTTGHIGLACGDLRLTIVVEPFSGELRLTQGAPASAPAGP